MKATVPSLDAIPENLRSLAEKQDDGTYSILLAKLAPAKDIADANGKIVELRDTNIKLLKGIGAETIDAALVRVAHIAGIDTAKLERLKVIDPDEYVALKEKAGKLKDKGLDDPDAVDARLKTMLDAALKPVTEKLNASEAALSEERKRNEQATLRQQVGEKFLKVGGKAKALDFIVGQASSTFKVEGGVVKAASDKFSADKPGEPLGVDEWLLTQAREHDFAFEPSAGGGAKPGAGGGNPGGSGVAKPGTFRTSDGKELKTDGITVLQ